MKAEEHPEARLEAHLEVVCSKKLALRPLVDMALVDIATAPPDKVEAWHQPA